jgi:uncharacterized protein
MRRSDRAIPEAKAREILRQGQYGVLSTVSPDGQPYGVPVSYSYVNDAIYFHSALEGHKIENLAANDRVSFCVVAKMEILPDKFTTRYESAIVFGKALELTGAEKKQGLAALIEKYSLDFLEEGMRYIETSAHKTRVFRIAIESFGGKSRM